jgi:outer membrane protein
MSAPTPTPIPTTLPYPAYGTPAPDVAQLRLIPGVPTSVSVSQAVDIAVVRSPVFAGDRATYEEIRAKYYSEKSALFPSVTASGAAIHAFGKTSSSLVSGSSVGSGGTGGASTLDEVRPQATAAPSAGPAAGSTTTYSGSISVQQLIYDGGRVIAAIRSAKEADIAGRNTLLRDLQTLENSVAIAYYNVLEADALVHADAELVRQFQVQEDSVRASIRAGAEAESDLAAAQFQTAKARGTLVTAQGQLIAAQSTFANTLGLEPDALIVPQNNTTSTGIAGTPTYPEAVAQALLQRPDYIAAEHSVESAKENLRFAKLARFPVISAVASENTSKTTPIQTAFGGGGTIGAQISIPIFDQGVTNFNVATAAAQLDQANATLTLTQLDVKANVRTTLSALISARATLVQARSELRSAQVSLNAANAQYRVGIATIVALVTAEANLATAQSDYVAALYGLQTAGENYNFAVGISDLHL